MTRYAYDAGDRVRRIENADGVVTELVHDFGGRRTQIERHGRTWRYVYNASGDMTAEVAPAPGAGRTSACTRRPRVRRAGAAELAERARAGCRRPTWRCSGSG
ncbi:MAG: hypothetical protein HS111_11335 [Kofleriaceae bacterium]|nr:hypothetical protein [Kofleriaceae bacterium]